MAEVMTTSLFNTLLIVLLLACTAALGATDVRDDLGTRSKEAADALSSGMKLVGDRNPADAVPLLKKAIAADPDLELAYYWLAIAHQDLGDIDSSLADYQLSISKGVAAGITNVTVDAAVNLALTYSMLKKEDDAALWFTKAIELDPADKYHLHWKAYRNMAIGHHEKKRFAEAMMCALLGYLADREHVSADMVRDFSRDAESSASEGGNILEFSEAAPPIPTNPAEAKLEPLKLDGVIDDPISDILIDTDHDRTIAVSLNHPHLFLIDEHGSVKKLTIERPIACGACVAGEIYVVLTGPSSLAKLDPDSGKILDSWDLAGAAPDSIAVAPVQKAAFFPSNGTIHRLDLESKAITDTAFASSGLVSDPLQHSVYSYIRPASTGDNGYFLIDGQPVFVQPAVTDWMQSTIFRYRISGSSLLASGFRLNAASNAGRLMLSADGYFVGLCGGGGWRPAMQGAGGGYGIAVFQSCNLAHLQGYFNSDAYPQGLAMNAVTGHLAAIRGEDAHIFHLADASKELALVKGAFSGASAWSPDGHLLLLGYANPSVGLACYRLQMPADGMERCHAMLDRYHSNMAKEQHHAAKEPLATPEIADLKSFALGVTRDALTAALRQAIDHGCKLKPLDWGSYASYFPTPDDKSDLQQANRDAMTKDKCGITIYQMKQRLKDDPIHPVTNLVLGLCLYSSGQLAEAVSAGLKALHGDCGKTSVSVEALRLLAHIVAKQEKPLDAAYCYAWVLHLDRENGQYKHEAGPFFDRASVLEQAKALLGGGTGADSGANPNGLPTLAVPKDHPSLKPDALYRAMAPSVVLIKAGNAFGSGVCLGAPDLIVTNAHVVVGAGDSVTVFAYAYTGRELKRLEPLQATVIYRSQEYDLAVLKLPQVIPSLVPLDVSLNDPEPGIHIFAVGSPGMGDQVLDQSITEGIVSSSSRQIEGRTYLQHTAAINPGNSGGPAFNELGQVVGINTLKADLQGVGFAIPASVLRKAFQSPP